eukprot:2575555-Amphidinium_carterae.1
MQDFYMYARVCSAKDENPAQHHCLRRHHVQDHANEMRSESSSAESHSVAPSLQSSSAVH